MKPRMTDCPPAAFVEAGAELRLLSPFQKKAAVADPRPTQLPAGIGHRSPSTRPSAPLIDTGTRSQKNIQNP